MRKTVMARVNPEGPLSGSGTPRARWLLVLVGAVTLGWLLRMLLQGN